MDLEQLVITLLEAIKEADSTGADEIKFQFDKKQIHEIADAYNKTDWIEIY